MKIFQMKVSENALSIKVICNIFDILVRKIIKIEEMKLYACSKGFFSIFVAVQNLLYFLVLQISFAYSQ